MGPLHRIIQSYPDEDQIRIQPFDQGFPALGFCNMIDAAAVVSPFIDRQRGRIVCHGVHARVPYSGPFGNVKSQRQGIC